MNNTDKWQVRGVFYRPVVVIPIWCTDANAHNLNLGIDLFERYLMAIFISDVEVGNKFIP